MHHALNIGVAKEGVTRDGVVRMRRLRVREKLMRFLFGQERTITFVIPGPTVETVTIKELKEGDGYEQD
jgi:uncharacterized protein (DUF1810 family)